MKALSKPQSLRQMMLFDEKRQLFEWHDLTETTKGDVIRNLARLLTTVWRAQVKQPRTAQGGDDE